MNDVLNFLDAESFRKWLDQNHRSSKEITIFIFKKGYSHLGILYEAAVKVALCYGWIDSITHGYDEEKCISYSLPNNTQSCQNH